MELFFSAFPTYNPSWHVNITEDARTVVQASVTFPDDKPYNSISDCLTRADAIFQSQWGGDGKEAVRLLCKTMLENTLAEIRSELHKYLPELCVEEKKDDPYAELSLLFQCIPPTTAWSTTKTVCQKDISGRFFARTVEFHELWQIRVGYILLLHKLATSGEERRPSFECKEVSRA